MPFRNALNAILISHSPEQWRLHEALSYYSPRTGRTYTVPAGFTCDFASIPRVPVAYVVFKTGRTHRAGVLHDYLCRHLLVPRARADDIFHEALRSDGMNWIAAWIMWAAVRVYSITTQGR